MYDYVSYIYIYIYTYMGRCLVFYTMLTSFTCYNWIIIKSNIKNIDTICKEIYNLGYCNIYIISQIYNNILLLDIEDNKKSKIIYYIYECKVDLYKKCNFYICLLNMSYNIADYLIWI